VFTLRDLLLGVALPAVVTGLSLLLAWPIRPGRETWTRVVGGLALAVGYAAGHAGLRGVPHFPVLDSMDWLFWLALGLGAFCALTEPFGKAAFTMREFALGLSVPWVVVPHVDPRADAFLLGGICVGAMAFSWVLTALAGRHHGPALPLSLWLVASCAAISLALSFQTAGQLMGALAAALGAFTVIGFIRPALSFPPGGVALLAIVLGGLLPLGALYGLPVPSAILLGLAPLASFVAEAPPFRKMRPLVRGLVRVVAAGIPAAAATGLAVASYLSTGGAAG
jgi:hypothetical protein